MDLDFLIEDKGDERFGLQECVRTFDVRAAEVDFEAADDRSPLPVVPELEAEDTATRTHIRKRERRCERLELSGIEGRVTPAAAAVDTDIESDPIGNGAADGRRCDRRRPHGYVRRDC